MAGALAARKRIAWWVLMANLVLAIVLDISGSMAVGGNIGRADNNQLVLPDPVVQALWQRVIDESERCDRRTAEDGEDGRAEGAAERRVPLILRIDTPIEVEYYRHGGILPYVLRQLLAA